MMESYFVRIDSPPISRPFAGAADPPVTHGSIVPPGRTRVSPRKLRLLMLVEASGAGTGRHVLDLTEGLLARGHEVHLIYSTARMDPLFRNHLSRLTGARTLPLEMRTGPHLTDFRVLKAVKRYIREHGPFDVIHGHSSKGGALARLAAVGTGVPAFYTIHGMTLSDPNHPGWKRFFYRTVERGLSRLTRKIIAVSPEEAREALRLGFGESRVVLIPNGVDAAILTPRDDARQAIGVPPEAVVIGFVGRLVNQKAPDILVKAFARVVAALPQARLAVVGAGHLLEPMRALAKSLNIGEQVKLLGERDAKGVLAGFDIFAMSSRKEGLPYVLLEAMAAGLPLVTTDACGVEILIAPGVNGEVVPMDDIQGLSDALIRVASSPERIVNFGRASVGMAVDLTIDAMVERTVTAYLDATTPVGPIRHSTHNREG